MVQYTEAWRLSSNLAGPFRKQVGNVLRNLNCAIPAFCSILAGSRTKPLHLSLVLFLFPSLPISSFLSTNKALSLFLVISAIQQRSSLIYFERYISFCLTRNISSDQFHGIITRQGLDVPTEISAHQLIPAQKSKPTNRNPISIIGLAGTYRLSAYYIAKMIGELPLVIALPSAFHMISYPLLGYYNFDTFISMWGIVILK